MAGNAPKRTTGASDKSGERIALTFKRDGGDAQPFDMPLFTVPKGLDRIPNRVLVTTGIPKRDERGRTIDVHVLRHLFGTLLSKGGVAPRTAHAAMRHSDIHLTMMTYTDPKLLDVQGALDSLPSLPLGDAPHSQREIAKAIGTDDLRASTVKPSVTPAADVSGHSGSFAVLASGNADRRKHHNTKRKSLARRVCEQGFSGRDDRRCTFPNDLTGIRLFHSAIAQVVEFTADEFYSLAAATE